MLQRAPSARGGRLRPPGSGAVVLARQQCDGGEAAKVFAPEELVAISRRHAWHP